MRSKDLPPSGSIQRRCTCLIEALRALNPKPRGTLYYLNKVGRARKVADSNADEAKSILQSIENELRRKSILTMEQWSVFEKCAGEL